MPFLILLVCPFAMDLAFLLDASGSIGPDNYKGVKAFIIKLIEYFHVSSAGKKVMLQKHGKTQNNFFWLRFVIVNNKQAIYSKKMPELFKNCACNFPVH